MINPLASASGGLTATPPNPVADVAANAAAFGRRRELLTARAELDGLLAGLDASLGLDKLMKVEPANAYELWEYTCPTCLFDWLGSDIAPCPRCHPIRLYASSPINSRTLLPAMVLSPEERDWIVDQLPARALVLRSEAWSAPARLERPADQVDAVRNDFLERADLTDALAKELEEGRPGSVWLPLAQASVFSGRPYLLSHVDGYNRLVGRIIICRLEPVIGWMEQHLAGAAKEGLVRRAEAGFAVFIPSNHP